MISRWLYMLSSNTNTQSNHNADTDVVLCTAQCRLWFQEDNFAYIFAWEAEIR